MLNSILLSSLLIAPGWASPHVRHEQRALSPYAPVPAVCPATALVRPATGVNSQESSYISARKPVADAALKRFLASTGANFATASTYPTLALTSSGGGLRALLCGAGVHQAFDSRDSPSAVSGLYQALTYESGLSGGGWLLSSISANNWPTITSLKTGLWETAFEDSALVPNSTGVAAAYPAVTEDILAKDAAGYPVTIVDPYGRLLSYQLLYGTDGGVAKHVSDLSSQSNYTSHSVPFPVITALGVNVPEGECLPPQNATQYEFTPYEFGSWDEGVSAFANIKYLGSDITNGKPTVAASCVTGYDNQGYVLGTSSDIFNAVLCDGTSDLNSTLGALGAELEPVLEPLLNAVHATTPADAFALYPNPFKGYKRSNLVSNMTQLTLADGGEADQNNPIWPFLNRKSVNVLFVSDNSADTSDNFPNGSELYTTFVQAKGHGLGSRMPTIPPVSTFIAKGYNKKPTFFGCNSANSTLTIIYLPNVNYTFPSNESTFKVQYNKTETDGMIANGVLIGSYNNTANFATCVGCAVMKKSGTTLPSACTACFKQYCYN